MDLHTAAELSRHDSLQTGKTREREVSLGGKIEMELEDSDGGILLQESPHCETNLL